MRTSCVFSVAIAFILVSLSIHAGEMRTWTGANGKEIKAELVSFDGEKVKIRLENGAINTVKLERFSKKDQDFVKETKDSIPKAKNTKRESAKEEAENLKIGERLFREGRLLCMDGEFEHADTKLTEAVSYDVNEEKDEWRYFLFMTRYRREVMQAERDLGTVRKFVNMTMQHAADKNSPLPEKLKGISGKIPTRKLAAVCLNVSLMIESENQGDLEEAMECNDFVLELFPFDIEARHNRATLYLRQGENIKAINDLAMVLDEEPNYSPSLSIQASVLAAIGSFDAAIKAIDKAIKFAPDRKYREEYQQEKRKILEAQKRKAR